MQLRLLFLIVFFVSFGLEAKCQRQLVKNGSFDTVLTCPTFAGQPDLAGWTIPVNHTGTSDLFNLCAPFVSNGFGENVTPFNGSGFSGGFIADAWAFREYICDTLLAPLIANQEYIVSFQFRVGSNGKYTTDDLGFDLSNTMPSLVSMGNGTINPNPTSQNPPGAFSTGTNLVLLDSTNVLPTAYFFYDSVSVFKKDVFKAKYFCIGTSTEFLSDTVGADSVFWNFGDPTSGPLNTSTLFTPSHSYSDTGSYDVILITYSDTVSDTIIGQINIFPRQTLDLGPDTLLCEGDTLELNIQQDYSTYLWSDGSTVNSILVDSSCSVSVTLFGVCDTLQDTLNVRFDMPVQIDLGLDTTFCEGPSIDLNADVTVDADYQWNTGDTADYITVAQSGLYVFQAENGCGEFVDSISITVIPLPDTALLPLDTVNCFDATIVLERPVNDSITYIWSDSTSKLRFEIDSTQQVWLAAFNDCGFSVDTMNILFNGEIKTELGEDTNICDLDSIQLSGSDSTATYFWSTGDTTISIYTEVGLDENYIVTIFKGECAKVKSRRVRSSDIFCPSIDCSLEYDNVFSPNGDGINDLFRITSDCDVYSFDMTIYNRWGQLVHYSQNVAYGWDGFVNGEPAAEGVYYFVVEYKDFVLVDADRQLTRGSFTLTR
jgi:gliding motility-associated-like protein